MSSNLSLANYTNFGQMLGNESTSDGLEIISSFQGFIQDRILMVALTSIFLGLAHKIISGFFCILMILFFSVWSTDGVGPGNKMDCLLAEKGFCSQRSINVSYSPENGWHFIWYNGPMIVCRSTKFNSETDRGRPQPFPYFTVYCLRLTPSAKTIKTFLLGVNSEIKVRKIEIGNSYNCSYINLGITISEKPYKWQAEIVTRIQSTYQAQKRASVLICGHSGAGKTEVSIYIAEMFKKILKVEPIVVVGVSMTTNGLTLSSVIKNPTSKNPIILVLNEVDSAIRNADKGVKGEKISLNGR